MTKPTIGHIVNYVSIGASGGDRAAVVTQVDVDPNSPELVALCVINPTGLHFVGSSPHDEVGKAPGSWHWPEKV